jgi:hypothetical protein
MIRSPGSLRNSLVLRRYLYPLASSTTRLVDCFGLQCQASGEHVVGVFLGPCSLAVRRAAAARLSAVRSLGRQGNALLRAGVTADGFLAACT